MEDLHKSQQFEALEQNEYLKEALDKIEKRAIEKMVTTSPQEDDLRWKAQAAVLAVRELRIEIGSLKFEYAPEEKPQIEVA